MAQTGYTPILIYSSSTASQAPAAGNLTNSTLGSELAINITDGKLFYKDNANAVQVIGWKTTPTTAGGTGLTSYTAGDLLYYASGTTLSKLAIGASTTIMTSSGTAPQWSAASGITVGKATNIDGGVAGSVPYQSGAGATTFLGIGAANTVLTSSGSAPQWTAQSSLAVGTASNLLSNATTGVMQITGPGAGTTRVMTIPNANFTAARTDAAQTFTGTQTFATDMIVGSPSGGFSALVSLAATSANTQYSFLLLQNRATETATTGASIDFGGAANWLGRVSTQFTGSTGGGNSSMSFHTGSLGVLTERVVIDSSGNTTIKAGNIIQGTASKGFNFTANSALAGMTSQLLNWYEEGTWTPTATNITINSGTPTWSGIYTRIGRTVIATWRLTGGANINVSLSSYLSLPYTASDVAWGSYGNTSTNALIGGIMASSASLYFGTAANSLAAASGTIVYQV